MLAIGRRSVCGPFGSIERSGCKDLFAQFPLPSHALRHALRGYNQAVLSSPAHVLRLLLACSCICRGQFAPFLLPEDESKNQEQYPISANCCYALANSCNLFPRICRDQFAPFLLPEDESEDPEQHIISTNIYVTKVVNCFRASAGTSLRPSCYQRTSQKTPNSTMKSTASLLRPQQHGVVTWSSPHSQQPCSGRLRCMQLACRLSQSGMSLQERARRQR
jgi:hypothetical protein